MVNPQVLMEGAKQQQLQQLQLQQLYAVLLFVDCAKWVVYDGSQQQQKRIFYIL